MLKLELSVMPDNAWAQFYPNSKLSVLTLVHGMKMFLLCERNSRMKWNGWHPGSCPSLTP